MIRLLLALFTTFSLFSSPIATFKHPEGWKMVDERELPKSVKFMAMGTSQSYFPPSINLGLEEHKGTLKEYLAIVKKINDSQGTEWRDLGSFQTKAGTASLSEILMPTEWGNIQMMHVIFLKDGVAYILTAAAKKEEFNALLPQFHEAFRSFDITNTDDIAKKNRS